MRGQKDDAYWHLLCSMYVCMNTFDSASQMKYDRMAFQKGKRTNAQANKRESERKREKVILKQSNPNDEVFLQPNWQVPFPINLNRVNNFHYLYILFYFSPIHSLAQSLALVGRLFFLLYFFYSAKDKLHSTAIYR